MYMYMYMYIYMYMYMYTYIPINGIINYFHSILVRGLSRIAIRCPNLYQVVLNLLYQGRQSIVGIVCILWEEHVYLGRDCGTTGRE